MNRRRISISRIKRLRYGLIIGIGLTGLLLVIWFFGLFSSFRLRMMNIYYIDQPTTDTVVIIALDNASLDAYGRIAEWPRTLHADLVNFLADANARVIVFDVLFAEPSVDEAEDAALNEAIANAYPRTRTVMPMSGDNQLEAFTPDKISYGQFIHPTQTVAENVSFFGFVNITPDSDGILRWQPLRASVSTDPDAPVELSLAAAAYLSFFRVSGTLAPQVVSYEDAQLQLGPERTVPVDDQARMLINFFGRPESDDSFATYSFKDVVEGRVNPAAFTDKIVMIGAMNATGVTDIYPVPLSLQGQQMSGVAVHSNVVETLLQGRFLSRQSAASEVAFIIGFAILAMIVYAQLRWRWLFVVVFVSLILWVTAALVYFQETRVMWNLFEPSLALLLAAPIALALDVYLETERREWAEFLLDSAVQATAQQLKLNQVLASISQDAARVLNGSAVEIWLWDNIRETLELHYPHENGYEPVAAHQKLGEQALDKREIIDHVACVAVPLTWQDKPQGAILVMPPANALTRRWRYLRRRSAMLANATNREQIIDLFAWQTASIIANAELYGETEALSELKTNMIRMASHDLKNPIGSIIGYTELLQDDQEDEPYMSEEQVEFLSNIMIATEKMQHIVNDILSLERVRAGQLNVHDYDLKELVARIGKLSEPDAREKSQQLTLNLPDEFPIMVGDSSYLREAISNLVGNAIKYTPDNGLIKVRLTRHDGYARVIVADNGPGIAKEAQEKLFQEFYRVRTTENAHIKGTGLGLSLVRSVAEAHKGKVWVESEAGKGCKFILELPIDESKPAKAQPEPSATGETTQE